MYNMMNTCTIFKIIVHNSIRIYYTTKTYIINKLKPYFWKDDDKNVIYYDGEKDGVNYAIYNDQNVNNSPISIIEEQPILEESSDSEDEDNNLNDNWDIINNT